MNYNMVERCESIECLEELMWIYSNGSHNVLEKYIAEEGIDYDELALEEFNRCGNIIKNEVGVSIK